jgi:O-antigen/teichoic acid export membrane protein
MLRRFLKDSAVYGASTILSRAVTFLLIPFYTRFLTKSDIGAIELLTVAGAFVLLFVALEITQAVARQVALAGAGRSAVTFASTGLWYTLTAFALFLLAAWLFAPQIASLLFDGAFGASLVRAAAAFFAANALLQFCLNQLRWELKPWPYAAASIVSTLVSAVGAVTLIGVFGAGVAGIYYASVGGALCGTVIALGALRNSLGFVFDGAAARAMLGFSLPLAISGMALVTASFLDRIVINWLLGLADLGIYGVASRFASVIGVVLAGFQATVVPLVTTRADDPATPVALARMFRAFLALVLPVALALACLAPEILLVFTTPAYHAGAPLMPLLAMGLLLAGVYPFAPGLWLAGRSGLMLGLNVIVAAASLALNLALVQTLGLLGGGIAVLLVGLCSFALTFAASQRHYPAPFEWQRIGPALALAIAACAGLTACYLVWGVAWSPSSLALRLLFLGVLTAVLLRLLLAADERAMLRSPAALLKATR